MLIHIFRPLLHLHFELDRAAGTACRLRLGCLGLLFLVLLACLGLARYSLAFLGSFGSREFELVNKRKRHKKGRGSAQHSRQKTTPSPHNLHERPIEDLD
jgi:hypothetical protein